MSIMSEVNGGTMRRSRRIGVVAGLMVAVAAMAGCSGSADSASEAVYDAAAAEVDSGGDAVTAFRADERSVIITGSMYMTVEDPIAAADQAAGIVQQAGGRIDARSETAPDERNGGSASLTLRIPTDDLDAVVDDLRELGTVDQFSTDSYDVTTEVTDLEAQISTLRASTARIQALLVEAKDISDIIKLESELDGRQVNLESLEARQRGLDDQVSMSTINMSLTTEPVVIVDDSPETFWDGLVSGWNGLVAFIAGALVVLGVLLPWIAVVGLIAVAAIVALRATRSRAARRAAASAQASRVPVPPAPPTAPTPPHPPAPPAP